MFTQVDPAHCPFTPDEIHQLLSYFEQEIPVNSTSGSDTTRSVYSKEEQKRRRMTSNRESARRSRQRKKTHLENLTSQLNWLRTENRELRNRLSLVKQQKNLVEGQSQELRFEAMDLQIKLSGLYQVLLAIDCNHQY